MEGHAAVVATLLAKGALVDKADNEGSAPLHAAAAMGHEAVVEKLLAHGAQTEKARAAFSRADGARDRRAPGARGRRGHADREVNGREGGGECSSP